MADRDEQRDDSEDNSKSLSKESSDALVDTNSKNENESASKGISKDVTPYGYIYVATNKLNGKVYVGKTTANRWKESKIPIKEHWKEECNEAGNKSKIIYLEPILKV